MKTSKIVNYVLKVLAYGLCALGCFYQVVSIINIYFSFPTTVFSFVETMDTLPLPAISICNNNRIVLSKLKQFDSNFNKSWTQLERRLPQAKVVMQQLLDSTIRNLLDTLNVSEFAHLGYSWNEFIHEDYFKCATDPFHLDNKCLKYANIIESSQEVGNCFTIFRTSEADFLKNIAIGSGLSMSPVIRGVEESLNLEIADQPFNPNEIFRMMANFRGDEYTTLNEKVMGFIMIHDVNELPPISEKSFFIYPGYYYEFYISKQTGKYLPSPYVTDCANYGGEEKNGGGATTTTTSHTSGFVPTVLTRETCIINCLAEKTVALCACWPPELPYIVASNSSEGLKWCSWLDGMNIHPTVNKTDNLSWFRFCFSKNEPECKRKCKKQCLVDRYSIIRESFVWPSDQRIEHSKKFNKEHRKCCALISVRFWSSEQTIYEYEPRYEFVEFISYFGGLLSMWLGFSFIKTYDIVEIVFKKIMSKLVVNNLKQTKLFERITRMMKARRLT